MGLVSSSSYLWFPDRFSPFCLKKKPKNLTSIVEPCDLLLFLYCSHLLIFHCSHLLFSSNKNNFSMWFIDFSLSLVLLLLLTCVLDLIVTMFSSRLKSCFFSLMLKLIWWIGLLHLSWNLELTLLSGQSTNMFLMHAVSPYPSTLPRKHLDRLCSYRSIFFHLIQLSWPPLASFLKTMHVNFAFRQKTITKCVLNSGPVRETEKMVPALEKLSIILLPLMHVRLE